MPHRAVPRARTRSARRSHNSVNDVSKRRIGSTSARAAGRARRVGLGDGQRDRRYETIERHRPLRQLRRDGSAVLLSPVSPDVWEVHLLQYREDASDNPRPSDAPTLRSHVRNNSSPRPAVAVRAPPWRRCPRGRISFTPSAAGPGIVGRTDDGRSFAHQPQQRRTDGIIRITGVLPIPSQPARRGGVGAEHAAIERLYAALVLRPVPINLGHL